MASSALAQDSGAYRAAPWAFAMRIALRASYSDSGALASVVKRSKRISSYVPRFKSSNFASTVLTEPLVSPRTTFSMTTTSLGKLTAKYGSAVTIMANVWRLVVTANLLLLPSSTTSPKLLGLPSGEMAHKTYVKYAEPKVD